MLHPSNKQLLYFFIKNGARSKKTLIHPKPLIDQLEDLNLLQESDEIFFINHEKLITIRQGEEDHFFVYISADEGYYLEYLNERTSEPIIVQTNNVRELFSSAQDYLLQKNLFEDQIKKKKNIQDIFMFF